ncbi:MAG: TatD family hydrolase [Bacteroidetes bacterium]|nr:TatD family hydrolase [Bacteroidota bacterium]
MSGHPEMYVDTHCHLFWDDFREDTDAVIMRAREAGVTRMIIPATNLETFEQARAIAERFEGVYLAAGIHPHDAGEVTTADIETLRGFLSHPRVVAVGEIGLDYFYDFCSPATQQRILHLQLALATEHGLPVIIHNRESDEDLIAAVREHQDGRMSGQFHCFSSDVQYARAVLDAGFHISFTGNVTFKKSVLDPVLSYVPDDRLLMETDSPFMTPVPHRGKRNEPSLLPVIARRFALTRDQSTAHIADITTRNAERLFQLERKQDS